MAQEYLARQIQLRSVYFCFNVIWKGILKRGKQKHIHKNIHSISSGFFAKSVPFVVLDFGSPSGLTRFFFVRVLGEQLGCKEIRANNAQY